MAVRPRGRASRRSGNARAPWSCVMACEFCARKGGAPPACEYCGCNGGRARCPHRVARVMRVGKLRANFARVMACVNGGAIMTSRRVRGLAAHRAAGGEPPLASRGMQNSQRVLLAMPRTAVASRHGRRGAGGQAAHRAVARRRDGDIAPYRYGARAVRTATGNGRGMRAMGGEGRECGARGKAAHGNRDTSGAHVAKPRTAAVSHRGRCDAAARAGRPGGQASRPTATGHECGARRRGGWQRTRVARTATGCGRCGWLGVYGNIKKLY